MDLHISFKEENLPYHVHTCCRMESIIQPSGKYKMVQLMDVVQLINTRASLTNSAVQHYHMQYTGAELSILICIASTRSRCLISEGHLM